MDRLKKHSQQENMQVDINYKQPDLSDSPALDSLELEERARLLIWRCQQLLDQIKEKADKMNLKDINAKYA